MNNKKVYTAIGLMSGTSLDGIDAALIRTDGEAQVERIDAMTVPYDDEMRNKLRACLGQREDKDGRIRMTEIQMTRLHAAAIDWLLGKTGLHPRDVDIVGFHGQTIFHDPANRFTWQIGSGPMLAALSGIDVVNDLRAADVAAGGQGAPFLPLYHIALAAEIEKPAAILNVGGVSNVTFLGEQGEIIAFDTGPGNALLDDWVQKHLQRSYDENSMLARQGTVDDAVLATLLDDLFFTLPPPKSLDRDQWQTGLYQSLSVADGAATLTEFTVRANLRALDHLPQKPKHWYVTGGGRHNPLIMEGLAQGLGVPVRPVDDLGWSGDSMEAEGFAYLAVRALRGLPLSLPTTTGVPEPMTGGVLHEWEKCRNSA